MSCWIDWFIDWISLKGRQLHTCRSINNILNKQTTLEWTGQQGSPSIDLFCFGFQINDIVSEFEQEKFDMQKQHTKNIQEILDDTNARLQKMEKEYSQQTTATVCFIYRCLTVRLLGITKTVVDLICSLNCTLE